MRKRIIIAAAVIGLGAAAIYFSASSFFGSGRGGGGGGGSGTGSGTGGQVATQAAPGEGLPGSLPQGGVGGRPLSVTIDAHKYLVNGREMTLEAVVELASKVPPGQGPAVLVKREPASRAKAEIALREKLESLKITSSWEPPL